jgi:hypothetical protein
MITISKPLKGVQVDNHERNHDMQFARNSVNGRFTSKGVVGTWDSIDAFLEVASLDNVEIVGKLNFENDTYLMCLYINPQDQDLAQIYHYDGATGSVEMIWVRSNTEMGWDVAFPITGFLRRNTSRSKLFIYITDKLNEPRAFDLYDPTSQSSDISDLSISQKKGFLHLSLNAVTTGGNLTCGTYYYAAMAYKASGISTDWFIMPGHVMVPNKIPSLLNSKEFQSISGGRMDQTSNAAVQLKLENFGVFEGWKLKIAYFIALDEKTLDLGYVFYDGEASQIITHTSNLRYEQVNFSDIFQGTLSIRKAGQLTSNGEIAVIADLTLDTGFNGDYFDNVKFLNSISSYLTYPKIEISLLDESYYNQAKQRIQGAVIDSLQDNNINNFLTAGQTKEGYSSIAASSNAISFDSKKYYWKFDGSEVLENKTPTNGFSDYSNPIIEHHFKNYRKGEEVRFAMLPYDLYGKEMKPIYLGTLKKTDPTNTLGCILASKYDGSAHTVRSSNGHFFVYYNLSTKRLCSEITFAKIDNIIMNDFVERINGINYPKISGFSIVQAYPSTKRIVAEGVATRITDPAPTGNKGIIQWNRINESLLNIAQKNDGWLIINAPELLYGETISKGMKVIATTKSGSLLLPKIREISGNDNMFFQKLYTKYADITAFEGVIDRVYELPYLPEVDSIEVDGLGQVKNRGGRTLTLETIPKIVDTLAMGQKRSYLIKIEPGSSLYSEINNSSTAVSIPYYTVRIENEIHGFPNEDNASLENTEYHLTNHYQPVNSAFFEDIRNPDTDDFIANIAVYGGKYIPSIYEIARIVPNGDVNSHHSHVVYLPVMTEFNLRMRDGFRHSRDRIVVKGNNLDGIGLRDGEGQHEQFLLSPSYRSTNHTKLINPVPLDFNDTDRIVDTVFWTNRVAMQGSIDTLRRFYPGQYRMCDRMGGIINGLSFEKDRLYVFQSNAIGLLPYEEKTMSPTIDGGMFTISYGGIFPKYEGITRLKGITDNQKFISINGNVFFFCYLDKTLNSISNEGVSDVGIKMGIQNLILEKFANPSNIEFAPNQGNTYLFLRSGYRVLEISITFGIVNGYFEIPIAKEFLGVVRIGNKIAFVIKEEGSTRIYTEDKTGTIKIVDNSELSLILGSESSESKTFDTVSILSEKDMLPEKILFKVGNREAEEAVDDKRMDIIIDGPTIITNTPFVFDADMFDHRLRDYSVMMLTMKSVNKMMIHEVTCEYRKNI